LAMSLDNASSMVTYTSISSYSNGLSWGIPLVNAGELPEIDEVAQQGQAPPLSPAYVPDPMELDEHVPSMEDDSIDYPGESEDDNEDLKEDPEEDHTDYPADREDGDDEPFDDDDNDKDEDEEPTEDKEEEEEHLAPADPSAVPVTRLRRARKTIRLDPPMSASMEARIAEHVDAPIPPTSPTYDQAPLGHGAAMICMRDDIPEEDMPPRRRFVLTAPPPGCDVAESSAAVAARPPRAANRAEDVGYVIALHAIEHRMMTSIEEVNLRRAEDDAVRQMMHTHVLEARAQIDTVEDTDSSC
ncbi:hypothetical protein Tco_1464584, partial [Tanacetum coccineum]